MAQISLYIEDFIAEKLNMIAKAKNYSVSKYVSTIITERISEDEANEEFKRQFLRSLKGTLNNEDVIGADEVPWTAEIQRRYEKVPNTTRLLAREVC